MEQKEEGISLGEIFHVMFIKKWLLLGITVFVMIIGVILVELIYNPSHEMYTIEYELDFLGYESAKYPDGKSVNYSDFISLANLQAVKSSKTDYESIDVEKIANENDISINQEVESLNNSIISRKYTIVVPQKYFSSTGQAKEFLEDLAKQPIEYVIKVGQTLSYDFYLLLATNASDYVTQINNLVLQRDLLIDGYQSLIDAYGNGFTVNGQTLSQVYVELTQYFNDNRIETLPIEVKQNGYLKEGSDFIESVHRQKEELLLEKQLNEAKIQGLEDRIRSIMDILNGTSGQTFIESISPIIEQITTLSTRNDEIDHIISDEYDHFIENYENGDKEKNKQCDDKINQYIAKIAGFTKTYSAFRNEIYNEYSYVVYSNSSVITGSGGINLIIGVIGSLVLGFIVGCCVNLIIDLPSYLKDKKAFSSQSKKDNEEETKE